MRLSAILRLSALTGVALGKLKCGVLSDICAAFIFLLVMKLAPHPSVFVVVFFKN